MCAQILPYADVLIGNIEDSDTVGVYTNDSIEHNPDFCKTMVGRYPNLKLIATILRDMPSANIDTWGGILYDVKNDKQYVGPLVDGTYAPWHINDIVDPIGVGDAFSAGLVYAVEHGLAVEETVAFAAASFALITTHALMRSSTVICSPSLSQMSEPPMPAACAEPVTTSS